MMKNMSYLYNSKLYYQWDFRVGSKTLLTKYLRTGTWPCGSITTCRDDSMGGYTADSLVISVSECHTLHSTEQYTE